jgi:protein O-GlcNAcase/histone acetyltransferase
VTNLTIPEVKEIFDIRAALNGLRDRDIAEDPRRHELLPEIEIFWTGPDIISREITAAHARELQSVLRRKPLIWDNLHANDYDGRRFFCGPYDGRPAELIPEINGLMINPNTEFELNFIAINTFGEFVRDPLAFDPRRAYLAALEKWLPRFGSVGKPVLLEDLVLLGDCYYLPYDDGVEAIGLLTQVLELLRRNPSSWGPEVDAVRRRVTGFRDVCARLAELRHRPLFNALSRRIWELREELDLLDRYIAFKAVPTNRDRSFISDFHRTGTYRGGFVVALQRLLTQQDNGIFDAVSH